MSGGRISQLDGLRGLAAMMVVLLHALLVVPALGGGDQGGASQADGWTWWLTKTPLAALWNGGAAVLVFFVLSGFVLAIPFTHVERVPSWLGYNPRRLVRLYLPVWGAVMLAVLLYVLFPRNSDPAQSWWVNRHDVPFALKPILADGLLVRGTSWFNSPLWSLQYEVIFSLLLPVVLFFVIRLARLWSLLLVGLLAAVHVGDVLDNGYLKYLPVFVIGVVLAQKRQAMSERFARLVISTGRRYVWRP